MVVALLALFASLAILVGAALGRMEGRLRADMAEVRADVAEVAADMAEVRADVRQLRSDVSQLRGDVHALSDRVARIEGTLTAPRGDQAAAGG